MIIANPIYDVVFRYLMKTREVHDFRHAFMESLSHDSIFMQIPHLTNRRKTNLEKLLYVFDQSNIDDTRRHFLNIGNYLGLFCHKKGF